MKKITLYSYNELNRSAKASAYKTMAADHNFMIKQEMAECAKVICKAFSGIVWDGTAFYGCQDDNFSMTSAIIALDDMHNVELKNIIMSELLIDMSWNVYGYPLDEWLNSAYKKFFYKYKATPESIAEYCKDCHKWFYVNGAIYYDE